MNLPQRIRDYLREREIRRLSACMCEAFEARDVATARVFDAMRVQAVLGRSDAQVERMEQRQMKSMDPLSRRIFEANRVRRGRE